MTSFIFETSRKYRKDNYRKVKLECLIKNEYKTLCETPEKVGHRPKNPDKDTVADPDTTAVWSSTEEPWSPGDHIEMFDHKTVKVYKQFYKLRNYIFLSKCLL